MYTTEFRNTVIDCLINSPNKAKDIGNGWTYAINYRQFQKVNKLIYVYILFQGDRVLVQAYLRGDTTMCCLESRYPIKQFIEAFHQGDEWLEKYGTDTKELELDTHCPFNKKNTIPYHI